MCCAVQEYKAYGDFSHALLYMLLRLWHAETVKDVSGELALPSKAAIADAMAELNASAGQQQQ